MLSKYKHRYTHTNTDTNTVEFLKQCIVKWTYYKTRNEDGEAGRQALPYRSAERGLYSREPWERERAKSGMDFATWNRVPTWWPTFSFVGGKRSFLPSFLFFFSLSQHTFFKIRIIIYLLGVSFLLVFSRRSRRSLLSSRKTASSSSSCLRNCCSSKMK